MHFQHLERAGIRSGIGVYAICQRERERQDNGSIRYLTILWDSDLSLIDCIILPRNSNLVWSKEWLPVSNNDVLAGMVVSALRLLHIVILIVIGTLWEVD